METFTFTALGTQWSIMLDTAVFSEALKKQILEDVQSFEHRFSRFLPESQVNQFREAPAGTYTLSALFTMFLKEADKLRILTDGAYDPAIGGLLEHAGYGATYRLESDGQEVAYHIPRWSLVGQELTIDGAVVFDLGGIGKGYCIDMVADILKQQGEQFFLVEGGGDMYGTTKCDGSPYRVALEWPGKPDMAFGVVELRNQGIAVSDSFKRRWGKWHHILDPHTKQPIESVLGAATVAPSAFAADCMTSGLFLAPPQKYGELSQTFEAQYVVFRADGTVGVSLDWQGELF